MRGASETRNVSANGFYQFLEIIFREDFIEQLLLEILNFFGRVKKEIDSDSNSTEESAATIRKLKCIS